MGVELQRGATREFVRIMIDSQMPPSPALTVIGQGCTSEVDLTSTTSQLPQPPRCTLGLRLLPHLLPQVDDDVRGPGEGAVLFGPQSRK